MKLSSFVNFFSIVLITVICLLSTVTTHAQGFPIDNTALVINASSNNPAPGQTLTLTLTSYSFDINSATIIWSVDNKQIEKGIGLTSLEVTSPALGKKKSVTATASTPDGSVFTKTYIIGSGYVDMIMETDGYTPPLFKGKAPLVFQNTSKIIAVPHLANSSGKEYDPATLVYLWKKDDGTVFQDQSGYGKQSISLKGNIIPRSYFVTVTVTTRDGSAQAENMINVIATSPSIYFYNNDPLYGPLFNKSIINSLHIGSQMEARILGTFYGFNFSNNISKDLILNWTINDQDHPELASNKSVTLRAPDGVSGTSHISLGIRGIDNFLQGANSSFDISFDANSSASSIPVNL